MQHSDILKYCDLMTEVKRRIDVLNGFGSGLAGALYRASTIESVYLQFRKILELIAFGSLVANKNEFSKAYSNFSKCWNAKRLLQDMEKVNPYFYPRPLATRPAPRPIKHVLTDKKEGFLTRSGFVILYNQCGAILHAENPFGNRIDYDFYADGCQSWIDKITGLLSVHQIRLVADTRLYVVSMQGHDGKVHHTTFERYLPPKSPQDNREKSPGSSLIQPTS